MLVFTGMFLFNLFCALGTYCAPRFKDPEISDSQRHARNFKTFFEENENLIQNTKNTRIRESEPIVETNYGKLQGYTIKVSSGREIWSFEGIPFGKNTGGQNRFRPPIPVEPWKGVRKAQKFGEYCAQMHLIKLSMVMGSEDCLNLNIYTPSLENGSGKGLPVLIWIHGGSFIFGGAKEFGPSYLLSENDMVLVTINYRQGPLGFLSVNGTGNWGLKDQLLGMKWVNENIKQFGGDPSRVTLMGQSGGAVSVHLHMFSKESTKYFNGLIALSGSAFLHWAINQPYKAQNLKVRIAKTLRCPTNTERAMVDCLRRRNFARVAGSQMSLFEWIPFPFVFFAPTIEKEHDGAFLTEDPSVLYERGNVAKYPAIFSITKNEGSIGIYATNLLMRYAQIRRNPELYMGHLLDLNYLDIPQERKKEIVDQVEEFYFPGKSFKNMQKEDYNEIMGTDRYFTNAFHTAIKAHSAIAPTYGYIFSYLSQYNFGKFIGQLEADQGVAHTEDVFFYFNSTTYYDGFGLKDPEFELSQIMINLITNFIYKREPLYTDKEKGDIKIWDKIEDIEKLRFLDFEKDIIMVDDPYKERIKFWESLNLPDIKKPNYVV